MTSLTLYLDFDGVLHPNSVLKGEIFSRMSMLEEAIDGFTPNLVISSTWRLHESLEYLRDLLPASLRPLLIGTTGDVHIGRWPRWHEISRHADNMGIQEWRALDDARTEFPPDCRNLILCDGHTGMQREQVQMLRAWLVGETL